MKIRILIVACVVLFLLIPDTSSAQGGPPPWAPAHGYRSKTRYVYFPVHNFYFDLRKGVYIYPAGGSWTATAFLPAPYASVNLSAARQVELDIADDDPWKFHNKAAKPGKAEKSAKPGKTHPVHGEGHSTGQGRKK